MLQRIQVNTPKSLKFHLVGHSFGGRLVTATVDGANSLRVQTLLLLQAAYSHNGLAAQFDGSKDGFFHAVFDRHKVTGPILITHSNNDRAVGLAYPVAARLNGDDAAGLGDKNDRFGGMGAWQLPCNCRTNADFDHYFINRCFKAIADSDNPEAESGGLKRHNPFRNSQLIWPLSLPDDCEVYVILSSRCSLQLLSNFFCHKPPTRCYL